MKRKAILIASPGSPADKEHYCKGVFKDLENYQDFLKSSIGGAWRADEITPMIDPFQFSLLATIGTLADVDYSMVVFCGHGAYNATTKSTWIEIRPGKLIDSDSLRLSSGKQLLILDCCRDIYEEAPILEHFATKYAAAAPKINRDDCRKYFNKKIEECPDEICVLHSCDVNQRAGDCEESGGIYSFNLIEEAKNWANKQSIDTDHKYVTLHIPTVHDWASKEVTKKRGIRQTPVIEKARSGPYFPFAIVA